MPLHATIMEELQHFWNVDIQIKNGLIQSILFIDEDTGSIGYGSIFVCYIFPVVIVYVYWLMMKSTFAPDEDLGTRVKLLELKNMRTKERMRAWLDQHPNYKKKVRKWE